MSERRYYIDSYTTRFDAKVIEQIQEGGRTAVVLDQTFFYPASGGQPADSGTINGVPIVDVAIRETDDQILHWLDKAEFTDVDITAEVAWARRFDHMQQHTGQHILSQAFIQTAEAETVSFHLSDETVTIDLDTNNLSDRQIERVEQLANEVVWQARPVRVQTVSTEEAALLPLRKTPPGRNGKLRLVAIEEFDLTACGGTHVANTSEVGLIKIVKLERRGEQLRVEFRCGRRAWQDYRAKHDIVSDLTTSLTTGQNEIATAVSKLQEDLKEARRTARKQQSELLKFEAERLLQSGRPLGEAIVISHVLQDGDGGQLKTLGSQLTKQGGVVALLGLAGDKSLLLFTRSADAPGEMNLLLKAALPVLGKASGGGSGTFAQGGGPAANGKLVAEALAKAEKLLYEG